MEDFLQASAAAGAYTHSPWDKGKLVGATAIAAEPRLINQEKLEIEERTRDLAPRYPNWRP